MKTPAASRATPGPDDLQRRNRALQSAVALRNCSLGPQGMGAGRRNFRSLMRAQALRWRQPATAGP